MAGSHGKIGAAVLSARACLRSGVGLLTTYVPKCGYEIVQISAPESMCLTDEAINILTRLPELKHYDAIGIGPGIGQDALTAKMLSNLLQNSERPLVLDADAINIISGDNELLKYLPNNTILTPHIKEFDRLVGTSQSSTERLKKQQHFSIEHQCIIVLKDTHTSVSSPEGNLYFNTSGNQGMATGGSGDVLTGIITGLLAQKYEPLSAAIIGVYYHGKAGDKGLKHKSYSSLIASDIIDNLTIERSE
jgi:NAD(P)H-hydrate epimerase